MTTKEVVEMIKSADTDQMSVIISDLIADHAPVRDYMINRYKEYSGGVEIKNRKFENPNKINSKLANDFRGEIVDSIVGYMYGTPIKWSVDPGRYSESELQKINQWIKDFQRRNDIADQDSTTGEYATICGMGARLLWVNKAGEDRVMNLAPWEVIIIEDQTLEEVVYAMIYYDVTEVDSHGNKATRRRIEWYDAANIQYFVESSTGKYVPDPVTPIEPHMYDFVPVIPFYNNNLRVSDFEKVSSLIDAYDRLVSDTQNELEEFRLAYLAFIGMEPTQESILQARRTGAFGLDVGDDVKFITKTLNVEATKDHRTMLKENIYHFSKTVDMSAENFSGGTQSGESRKWKLQSFENRAITKERKFTKGLRQMLKVLATAWLKRGVLLHVEDVDFVFTRNLPVDSLYQADIAVKLKGIASDETVLGFVPGVSDPKVEMEKIKQEEEARYSVEPALLNTLTEPDTNE